MKLSKHAVTESFLQTQLFCFLTELQVVLFSSYLLCDLG